MRSELENTLLALLALHPYASGYELHRVIEESTRYNLMASFSQIYPALRKLHEQGLVDYDLEPIKNRPGKKLYALTALGRTALQEWLASPVDYSRGFQAFDLRMSFSPLMGKDALLNLVDSAIDELEMELSNPRGASGRDPVSFGFVDEAAVDMGRLEFAWKSVAVHFRESRAARLAWLREFREGVEGHF
ncbi:MAG: PadR family transcriptional regulator [Coriobacteriia bacterium]|nr:PadR family transcriptional regulator [Coriobacteriia bacterium]